MLGLLKKRRAVFRLLTAAACVLAASLLTAAWRWAHAPHVWKPEEVPVAFWAWRAQTPAQEEVTARLERRARAPSSCAPGSSTSLRVAWAGCAR